MPNIIAIIQARVSSTRLPGKVLKPILGRPMLDLQVERSRQASAVDEIIVATSDSADDDALKGLCDEIGTPCFRGSLDDVLDRFYRCAVAGGSSHVVRLTGDCPLIDPDVIDRVIGLHLDGNYDYTCNVMPPTWPDGMDVEVIRLGCLAEAHAEALLPSEREHVTPFIRNRPDRYRLGNLRNDTDISSQRLTVDEPEDFEKIRRIYTALYPQNPAFTTNDILALLESDAALDGLNTHIDRNEGARNTEKMDVGFLDGQKQ